METVYKLPKLLKSCPLVDALIEIRFTSKLDKSAVFGFIYGAIKDDFPGKIINLPLSQIPAQVRDIDPSFQFKPLYRLEGDDVIVQLGSDVICVSSKMPYIGWDNLSAKALNIISKLLSVGAIDRVLRVGHRYINFFKGNIDDRLNLTVNFVNRYKSNNVQIRSEVNIGSFINTLQYSNRAAYKPSPLSPQDVGSIIDIDTFKTYSDGSFLANIKNELDSAHLCEKELFYSLLKEDFISELNPVY